MWWNLAKTTFSFTAADRTAGETDDHGQTWPRATGGLFILTTTQNNPLNVGCVYKHASEFNIEKELLNNKVLLKCLA